MQAQKHWYGHDQRLPACLPAHVTTVEGWIQGAAAVCHGLKIGFRAREACLLAGTEVLFPPGSQAAESGPLDVSYSLEADSRSRVYRAYFGRQGLLKAPSHGQLLASLQVHLHHLIAEKSVEHVFVHAGAVGWRGKALLLPGRSCSGKSTLVRELIAAGAIYISDEFAALDSNGLVHPFARPLSLRFPQGRVYCDPTDIGAEVASGPMPVGLVIVTRYERTGTFRPEPLTPGETMLHLLRNTVTARANPGRAMNVLRVIVSSARAIRSVRGEAGAAAVALLDLCESVANSSS